MDNQDPTEQFLSHYNREQRRLYAMIRSLLFSREDAEEVFQETCIALWRSFSDFEPGSNFSAWSSAIARNRVLAFRKRATRQPALLSDEMLSQLADDYVEQRPVYEARQQALSHCIEQLKPRDRDLMREKFEDDLTTVQLAERTERSLNTLYKSLRRIRKQLAECVRRRVTAQERAEGDVS